MPDQLIRLLRNEASKAARRKLPYFGFVGVGLLCVIVYFVGGQLSAAATVNAWGYTAFSMQLVCTDIGPIFIVVFAAMLVAEETGTGTIRAALAVPVHRWELYLAKAIAGLCYMVVLSAAAMLFSAALGTIHYHFGQVSDSMGTVYDRGIALKELLLSFALSWIPLGALVMYGLMISTFVRSPGAAVAVGISSLYIVDFTKNLVGLEPYIFTRFFTYPWMNMQQIAQGMDYQWRPEVWKMAGLSGISMVVLFMAGLIVFVKEDLNH